MANHSSVETSLTFFKSWEGFKAIKKFVKKCILFVKNDIANFTHAHVHIKNNFSGAPRAPYGRACSAPWVRKNGNLSLRKILVKASGMARERVRLRRTAYVALDEIFT